MHESTEATSRVIESSHREFTHALWVDWNNDGKYTHPLSDMSFYVERTRRDQGISSTAPEELMLIEGYSAAELTVEATGNFRGIPLAGHFAPYNGRSIFYTEGLQLGVSMYYEIGVWTSEGWEWFRQFTGVVRDVHADRETGGVSLDCLDNVEKLRTSVDIAPYGIWHNYLQAGLKRSGLVDSSSIIDLAARSGNFTMGPRTKWSHYASGPRGDRWGPILSVPFHGSIIPEFGMLGNDQSFHRTEIWQNDPAMRPRSEQYTLGPHGYLALQAIPRGQNGYNYNHYWIDEFNKQAGTLLGTWIIGTWIYWPGPNVNENSIIVDTQIRQNHLDLVVLGNNGTVEARIREHNGFLAYTQNDLRMTTPGWYYIEANILVENKSNYAMRIRINDEYSAENRWSGRDAGDINDKFSGLVRIENRYALSDLYVVKHNGSTAFAWWNYDRTPADTARVSWGRNRITYTLRESGREAWDLATEVASAEYGVVFFDEYGRFVFWNYKDVTERQSSPVRTYTIDDLQQLALRNTFDSVRNVWTVTTKTGSARVGISYDLKDGVPFKRSTDGQLSPAVFILPPRTSLGSASTTFWFTVDDHTIALNPNDLWDNSKARGQFGAWDQTTPLHALKSYSGTKYHDMPPHSEQKLVQRDLARLAMSNGLNVDVGFVLVGAGERAVDGQPRFRIEGTRVYEDDSRTWTIRDEPSIALYGERILELGNNFWLQDEFQTRLMLQDIVSRMGRPIPVSDKVTVPGDPRIQLGDLIQVQDSEGFGEQTWLQVYGIEREFDASNGLRDTYTVEAVRSSGQGIWDSPSYGLWDQSFIWS